MPRPVERRTKMTRTAKANQVSGVTGARIIEIEEFDSRDIQPNGREGKNPG